MCARLVCTMQLWKCPSGEQVKVSTRQRPEKGNNSELTLMRFAAGPKGGPIKTDVKIMPSVTHEDLSEHFRNKTKPKIAVCLLSIASNTVASALSETEINSLKYFLSFRPFEEQKPPSITDMALDWHNKEPLRPLAPTEKLQRNRHDKTYRSGRKLRQALLPRWLLSRP